MSAFDYHGRRFRAVVNSDSGEVSGETIFQYFQENELLWAEYAGGAIRKGNIVGRVSPEGVITMHYQHVNTGGEIRSGSCVSVPERLPSGLIRLHESWQWTGGEAGTSVIEEIV